MKKQVFIKDLEEFKKIALNPDIDLYLGNQLATDWDLKDINILSKTIVSWINDGCYPKYNYYVDNLEQINAQITDLEKQLKELRQEKEKIETDKYKVGEKWFNAVNKITAVIIRHNGEYNLFFENEFVLAFHTSQTYKDLIKILDTYYEYIGKE